jgi:cytochrome c553
MRMGVVVMALISLVLASGAGAAAGGPLDMVGAVKAMNCAACHGAAGQSQSETMPILAGMWPEYFKKAVEDYAAGRRPSPEMEPYAKQIIHLGVDDIGAYFAAQRRMPTRLTVDPAAAARGRAAAQPCVLCHGAEGRGDRVKLIPDISGQPVGYLRNQMILFKQDRRSPGDEKLKPLKVLFKDIPDQTIADLAAYFSSVR